MQLRSKQVMHDTVILIQVGLIIDEDFFNDDNDED